jgi:hypothetical protein
MRSKPTFLLAVILVVFLAVEALAGTHIHALRATLPQSPHPRTVVVELFTSEGCSSCPPADAFLKQLDDTGRVNDADVIAIEEHVDYWDRLGWRDPFSSPDWTERQEQYARAFHHDGPFTPQFVVNGRRDFVSMSSREALQSIVEASTASAAELRLSPTGDSPRSAEFSVTMENAPPETHSAVLLLAVTERGLSSNVLRGENQGRNLVHAPVLRALTRVRMPKATQSAVMETKAKIALDPSWKRENLRFVIFLQEQKSLHIVAAAASPLPH